MFVEQKIDQVLVELSKTQQLLQLFMPNLSRKKEVCSFLDISEPTLDSLIKKGILEENVHYVISEKRLSFVPESIISLKMGGSYKNQRNVQKIAAEMHESYNSNQLNPTASKILEKMGKIELRDGSQGR